MLPEEPLRTLRYWFDVEALAAFAPAFASLRGPKGIAFETYQKTMEEAFQRACEAAAEAEHQVDDDFLAALTSRALEELGWSPIGMDQRLLAIVRSAPVRDQKGRTLDRMPDGRWPAEHALTLMQQVAVNQAMDSLTSGGIFSINGPPGTGKTTLLMDVVAALVVERAKVLCSFDTPGAAFEKGWEVKYGDLPNPAAVFRLDPRLHGFSMVVASSNNGAVENITRELPNAAKLAQRFRDGADNLKGSGGCEAWPTGLLRPAVQYLIFPAMAGRLASGGQREEDRPGRSRRSEERPRNDALQEARAMVFLKAMQVHLAFVTSTGGRYERNLKRALEMVDGKPELGPILNEAAPHLWETLFLLVPVISTTFASFSRTFGHLGASSIGWLFVDEAGQAVPQHAVGALYRSRRALIVGDPFQVEPVIMMDEAADRELLDRHSAPVRYQSTATSIQVLADQVNRFGTYLKTHRGKNVWVGSPLTVHRRCVDPMFSISNGLAYDGKMVLGRDKESGERDLTEGNPAKGIAPRALLGPSAWIDVPGTEGNRQHYIPAQGEIALSIVRAYMANGWVGKLKHRGLPLLYIISPFRSVANEFKALLRKTRMEWAPGIPKRAFNEWLKASVGTVHTFQGKEQETVVFLLGGASDGAIGWMADLGKRQPDLNYSLRRNKDRSFLKLQSQRHLGSLIILFYSA